MPLTVGTRLGPYEILAPIGAGGMGEVYSARDPRIGRQVAIKVLPAAYATDPDRLRRFEQEVQAAGALNHPNILVIHDVGAHDGAPYIVSELLEGETLRERLGSGALPQGKAIDYSRQIAHGLAAAHDRGIVHRDLKPENLFLTTDGRVKILDFGLAKLIQPDVTAEASRALTVEAATQPGTVLGTMGYMSPEQVRGRPTDARSDLFSFGVILYEMLSGRRAFRGDTAADSMSAILKEDPAPLESPALDRIVRHCLEKSPTERFQSARDLAFHLEAVSGVSGASAVAAIPAARPLLVLSRLVLGIALLALAAVLAAFWLGRRIGVSTGSTPPVFRQLTFRRGTIFSARFAPDGQTIIYGAAWDGKPFQLFSARPESPESRSLGLPDADILSISPAGEMAISLGRSFSSWMSRGTLARAPLSGGAPREILENVQEAAWGPQGSRLAVVRGVEGRYRLEYPMGKVLYETSGWISHPRVSPREDLIGFIEHPVLGDDNGLIAVVDLAGKQRGLTGRYAGGAQGLAWTPSGDEIWYTAAETGTNLEIFAIQPRERSPKPRVVARIPGRLTLHDIFRDGRVLASRDTLRTSAFGRIAGESKERDLSWLDYSLVVDLSPDGKTLLFAEEGVGGGATYSVYLRKTDGSPAVRLGEGWAQGLSPDGRWALAAVLNPPQLLLLPAGAGEPRVLPRGPIESYGPAAWFPDGKRVAVTGTEPGHKFRVYVQDVAGGLPRPLSPEGFGGINSSHHWVSPDGRWIVVSDSEEKPWLCPAEGGELRPIPGLGARDSLIQWSPDSRSVYTAKPNELPANVYLVDIATGSKKLVLQVMPADPAGLHWGIGAIQMTPDGASYVYSPFRVVSDLFLIEGLK